MKLIKWRIDISKKGLEVPYIDEFYWTPLSIELSKNINETISFLKSLTDTEFLYTLECLDEIIERNPSKRLLDEVENIAISRNLNMNDIHERIESAKCMI